MLPRKKDFCISFHGNHKPNLKMHVIDPPWAYVHSDSSHFCHLALSMAAIHTQNKTYFFWKWYNRGIIILYFYADFLKHNFNPKPAAIVGSSDIYVYIIYKTKYIIYNI